MSSESSPKVAIVTGANKGIGYGIVKGLCEKFNGVVYLTSRNKTKGEEAVKTLKYLGYSPLYHQLDINDIESVKQFRDYIKEKYGGIDVLVNNAGIAFKVAATDPVSVQSKVTLETNYFGLLRVCQELFPLLRQNARVVNVSSSSGHLSRIPSAELRSKLGKDTLTIDELTALMNDYILSAASGTNVEKGWGSNSYAVSKVGVTALTRIQQRLANEEKPNRNLLINAVHPGYVNTDMSSGKGILTIEEGAKAPLYLAIGDHQHKGRYIWKDGSDLDWFASKTPELH